ncbi:hypothetical protein KSP39_PZI008942 [Platanthera zijinensis]|uniref:Uncharacterized protein n=1 Tax=Platanthera zijinensis TaxID=2320716 RepID=A0AAP0G7G1_9ASPA
MSPLTTNFAAHDKCRTTGECRIPANVSPRRMLHPADCRTPAECPQGRRPVPIFFSSKCTYLKVADINTHRLQIFLKGKAPRRASRKDEYTIISLIPVPGAFPVRIGVPYMRTRAFIATLGSRSVHSLFNPLPLSSSLPQPLLIPLPLSILPPLTIPVVALAPTANPAADSYLLPAPKYAPGLLIEALEELDVEDVLKMRTFMLFVSSKYEVARKEDTNASKLTFCHHVYLES